MWFTFYSFFYSYGKEGVGYLEGGFGFLVIRSFVLYVLFMF